MAEKYNKTCRVLLPKASAVATVALVVGSYNCGPKRDKKDSCVELLMLVECASCVCVCVCLCASVCDPRLL